MSEAESVMDDEVLKRRRSAAPIGSVGLGSMIFSRGRGITEEIAIAQTMVDRVERRFDLRRQRLAAIASG